jgi:hypothetical protein
MDSSASTSPAAAVQVPPLKRRLTQEQIEEVMALERRPFRSPGLDLFARMGPQGAEVLKILAGAAEHLEKLQDMKMEYKERVLRQFAAKGYVEVTDHEDQYGGVDRVWERDMVFD